MTIAKSRNAQPARATTVWLGEFGFEVTVAGGMWCAECGNDIRACNSEELDERSVRLICGCGHVIFSVTGVCG